MNSMKRNGATVMIMAAAMLLATLLSGCGQTSAPSAAPAASASPAATEQGAASAAPAGAAVPFKETFEFSWLGSIWAPYSADSTIFDFIQKATNTKINFEWAPLDNYQVRVNTALASGKLPDVIGLNGANLTDLIGQGAVVALDDYYAKDAPNITARLVKEDYPFLRNISDGKIYVIPYMIDFPPILSYMVRKDWLDRANLQVPATWDQWVGAWTVFRDTDANGDGDAANEIPIAGSPDILLEAFGIHSNDAFCVAGDGTYMLIYDHPNYRKYLEAMAKLYQDKLFDQEFATRTQDPLFKAMDSGLAGTAFTTAERAKISTDTNRQTNPGATWLCVPPITGPDGDQGIAARGKFGINAAVTVGAGKAGRVDGIMQFWNWIYSDAGILAMNYGQEGVHYDMKDGKPVLKADYIKGFPDARKAGLIFQPFPFCWTKDNYMQILTHGKTYEELDETSKIFYDGLFLNEKYFYKAPPVLTTAAYAQYSADLLPKAKELQANAITGKITVDQFFTEYGKLKTAGLAEVAKQAQEAWNNLSK